MTNTDFEISCRNIWKIFGPHPQRIKQTLNGELSRAEILEQTGHVVAVKNVSFGVRKGETFVVMGLSGSGKSTLVRCLSRLIEPTAGQVIIAGQEVMAMDAVQLRRLRRRKISMVFQHFGLFPHRNVLDNVSYGLEVQGVGKQERHRRAGQVLELVGLTGWERHYPGELSGGMQQRVGIARALAVDPDILLFDEPFSALDPLIRREMQDELLNLQKMMHKTIIFITHDFLEAVKLGDSIAIMKDGEVVQMGAPDQIIINPANNYVQEFAKDAPRSRVLSAGSIMRDCPVLVSENDPPEAVLARLQAQDSRVAFVNDAAGRFVGVLSLEEVRKAARAEQPHLKSLATPRPTVTPRTILGDFIRHFSVSDIPAPVIDSNDRLVGMVDQKAVILALGGDGGAG